MGAVTLPQIESAPASGALLAVEGLTKSFAGTRALDGVSFELERGTVHALLGGNGSGKSTTIKVLAGVYEADGGQITLGGTTLDAAAITPSIARHLGLRFVHQQNTVFPTLSVAENLAIGHGFEAGIGGRVRWREQRRQAQALLERFEIDAAPTSKLGTLGLATQTMITIARALQDVEENARGLLVLDEPTSALPPHEADLLLDALERYVKRGETIMYVSHRLEEIVRIADRATILRDGVVAASLERDEISHDRLVELIMGRKGPVTQLGASSRQRRSDAAAVVSVRGLSGGAARRIDVDVHEGEILGVAGLLGSGRTSLLRLLFGAQPREDGVILLRGRALDVTSPHEAMCAGIAYVPDDRLKDAAFMEMSVTENLGMAVTPMYVRGGRLRHRTERVAARGLMSSYMIKAASPKARFSTMSGGNQQKVVLARWLRREPQLILLDEPTQGVDVGARHEIWQIVRAAADRGAAVIAVCSDFDELAQVCDRALIVKGGRSVGERDGADLDGKTLEHAVLQEEAA